MALLADHLVRVIITQNEQSCIKQIVPSRERLVFGTGRAALTSSGPLPPMEGERRRHHAVETIAAPMPRRDRFPSLVRGLFSLGIDFGLIAQNGSSALHQRLPIH